MFCKICGGAIDFEVESINGTHAGMDYCVVILNARVGHEQSRAEAAENALAVSQAEVRGVTALYDASNKVNETLRQRVAELEARLVDEWRPVTEDELPAGMLIEVRFVTVVDEFTGAPAICTGNPSYRPDGFMWRPLPPPPAATE